MPKAYLENVLCTFNMHQAKEVTTSIGQHFKLYIFFKVTRRRRRFTIYDRNALCKWNWESDVSDGLDKIRFGFAVSIISHFMANPGRIHWEVLKWTLRYIKGPTRLGLVFKQSKEEDDYLTGYVNADCAGNLNTRKSMTSLTSN